MQGKRYCLTLRPTNAKNRDKRAAGKKFQGTFYARFKLPDGTWSTAKSTGTCNPTEAENWALDYMERGGIVVKERVKLSDIAEKFYQWPTGEYAKNRLAAGKRISERQCREKADALRRSVLPTLGPVKLADISSARVRNLRNELFESGLSGGSINKILFALRSLLEYAEQESLIQAVPKFELAADKQQRRGILTPDEVRELFALEWADARCFVANLTSAGSGLRAGEIFGLRHCSVHPEYLDITHVWTPKGLRERTKSDTERLVPIPDRVYRELSVLMKANPYGPTPESFVFWGTCADRPMDPRIATEAFYSALRDIGIDGAEKGRRHLDFHGWRHWYNSFLVNNRIPVHKIRSVVGHTSDAMTERYYHADEYRDVRELMNTAL